MSEFAPLPKVDAPRAFRLGVTSYVYPADIGPNLRALAPAVDDIELVFFESPEHSNLPSAAEVREWRALADAHDLTFTVHFPIDKALGSPNRDEREACLDVTLRLLDSCAPLRPHGWILHLEGIEPDAGPDRIRHWQDDLRPLLGKLCAMTGDPAAFCVENLGYPFEWCAGLLAEFPFSICLDFGHLWQLEADWRRHVTTWLTRTRIIHLYGTDNSSRHYSLEKSPIPLVREALRAIGSYNGVLTLETFGYDDTVSSMKRLDQCLR